MRVGIRGGTVNHGEPSLCLTCRSSVVARGPRLGDSIVACRSLTFGRREVGFPATSCTGYSGVRRPTLWRLEEIGWVLRSDPKRKTIGFVDARELTDDEKHAIEEEQTRRGMRSVSFRRSSRFPVEIVTAWRSCRAGSRSLRPT
jgi:hypothetical protein